ncbi:hypothetical protein D3C73_734650 [compost metagenome]
MPVIIPWKGNRQAFPVQHILADGMSPCASILMKEMVFAFEIDQPVRVTGGTADRRIMILGTESFIIIAASVYEIRILKVSASRFHRKSGISG